MSEPFVIRYAVPDVFVYHPDGRPILGLRQIGGQRWFMPRYAPFRGEDLPPEGVVEWMFTQRAAFAAHGIKLSQWWPLFACTRCGAGPLLRCWSQNKRRDGERKPMKTCHYERRGRDRAELHGG